MSTSLGKERNYMHVKILIATVLPPIRDSLLELPFLQQRPCPRDSSQSTD